MTTITYNGITIQDVLTEHVDQTVELDKTGVDPIGVRIRVSCRGIVHLVQNATLGVAVQGNTATVQSIVAAGLMHPRKRFTMTIGNVTLFDVIPGADVNAAGQGVTNAPNLGQMDINHGPKPHFEILSIAGETSMRVRFSVEMVVPNCPGGSLQAGYLNFRFWASDDIDCSNWTTTRTYQGHLRTFHKIEDPKLFRNIVMPPLQRGFKRETVALHESSDGLHLDFTIVDREYHAAPPPGMSSWNGRFTIASPGTSSSPAGHMELSFTLRADKSVPKVDVASMAVKVMDAKLHLLDGKDSRQLFADSITFTEALESNEISVFARVRLMGGKATTQNKSEFINMMASEFAVPIVIPGYNKEVAHLPHPTATLTGLFLSRLQTPCNPARMPDITDPFAEDEPPPDPESPTQVYTSTGTAPYYDNSYSSSHYDAPYSLSNISSSYHVDEMLAVMPYGATNTNTTDSVAAIPLALATARREVRIEACRLNKWPETPGRASFVDDNGIAHRLLHWKPMPSPPQLSADGVKGLHRCDFVGIYAMSRAPSATEKLSVGKLPYHVTNGRQGVDWRNIANTFFKSPKEMLG